MKCKLSGRCLNSPEKLKDTEDMIRFMQDSRDFDVTRNLDDKQKFVYYKFITKSIVDYNYVETLLSHTPFEVLERKKFIFTKRIFK